MSTLLKYPYKWGKEVVNAFVEKYPRATWNTSQIMNLSPGELRHRLIMTLCKGNSVRFEAMKTMVILMKDYDREDLARFSQKERQLLYKYLLYLCDDAALDEKIRRQAIDITLNRPLNL